MIRHETTIHINCPLESAFAFVATSDHFKKWQSDLQEHVKLTDAPLAVGSRFREVRQFGGPSIQIQAEVTVFERNKRLVTQTTSMPQVTMSYDFASEGTGTRLRYEFTMTSSGMMKLMEPVITASIKQLTTSNLDRLKSLLELAYQ